MRYSIFNLLVFLHFATDCVWILTDKPPVTLGINFDLFSFTSVLQLLRTDSVFLCQAVNVLHEVNLSVWGPCISCLLLLISHSTSLSLSGMSHEPKSPSLGMISTATRTTATVSPLTPSPLNGSIVPNGSPASQSAHSGFAAALRKLAKQAEEPRGKPRPPDFWSLTYVSVL